jgi:putative addiction module component (TIGR02574 family)
MTWVHGFRTRCILLALVARGVAGLSFGMATVTVSDLLHLSIAERIQLVEDLWDSVAAEAALSPDRLPVSDAQRMELLRRSAAHRQNPHEAMPLDEALDEIERTLG